MARIHDDAKCTVMSSLIGIEDDTKADDIDHHAYFIEFSEKEPYHFCISSGEGVS